MSLDIFDISGQKVLLTGAGRGIGKGIALAFAEAGADVAVSALTASGVNQVVSEIQIIGGKGIALTGDSTKSDDMDRIVESVINEFGHIDTLINCVGDAIRKPIVKLPGGNIEGTITYEFMNEIVVEAKSITSTKSIFVISSNPPIL